jgi:hypothetical protein
MRTVAHTNEVPQIQALADEDIDLDLLPHSRVCGFAARARHGAERRLTYRA